MYNSYLHYIRLNFYLNRKGEEKTTNFEDVYQKSVKISPDGKMIATGGTDGIIRLWSLPKMEPMKQIKAHEKEVDDVDFKINGKQV